MIKTHRMQTAQPEWELKLFIGSGRIFLGVHWGRSYRSWWIGRAYPKIEQV